MRLGDRIASSASSLGPAAAFILHLHSASQQTMALRRGRGGQAACQPWTRSAAEPWIRSTHSPKPVLLVVAWILTVAWPGVSSPVLAAALQVNGTPAPTAAKTTIGTATVSPSTATTTIRKTTISTASTSSSSSSSTSACSNETEHFRLAPGKGRVKATYRTQCKNVQSWAGCKDTCLLDDSCAGFAFAFDFGTRPVNHKLCIKMVQHLDSRCVLLPAPLVPGVPTKPRLESSIKKFKPHFIYDCHLAGCVKHQAR